MKGILLGQRVIEGRSAGAVANICALALVTFSCFGFISLGFTFLEIYAGRFVQGAAAGVAALSGIEYFNRAPAENRAATLRVRSVLIGVSSILAPVVIVLLDGTVPSLYLAAVVPLLSCAAVALFLIMRHGEAFLVRVAYFILVGALVLLGNHTAVSVVALSVAVLYGVMLWRHADFWGGGNVFHRSYIRFNLEEFLLFLSSFSGGVYGSFLVVWIVYSGKDYFGK